MAEYEKYQELQAKATELQMQWEKQMQDMETYKEKALHDLSNHYDAKLRDKQLEIDRVILCGFIFLILV
jgi:hypothetical protein